MRTKMRRNMRTKMRRNMRTKMRTNMRTWIFPFFKDQSLPDITFLVSLVTFLSWHSSPFSSGKSRQIRKPFRSSLAHALKHSPFNYFSFIFSFLPLSLSLTLSFSRTQVRANLTRRNIYFFLFFSACGRVCAWMKCTI